MCPPTRHAPNCAHWWPGPPRYARNSRPAAARRAPGRLPLHQEQGPDQEQGRDWAMSTEETGGFVFTSESVTGGHPDKMADQISDTILDAALAQDPGSRVAVETLLTTGLIVIAGELTTKAVLDYAGLARDCVRDIGYVGGEIGFDA